MVIIALVRVLFVAVLLAQSKFLLSKESAVSTTFDVVLLFQSYQFYHPRGFFSCCGCGVAWHEHKSRSFLNSVKHPPERGGVSKGIWSAGGQWCSVFGKSGGGTVRNPFHSQLGSEFSSDSEGDGPGPSASAVMYSPSKSNRKKRSDVLPEAAQLLAYNHHMERCSRFESNKQGTHQCMVDSKTETHMYRTRTTGLTDGYTDFLTWKPYLDWLADTKSDKYPEGRQIKQWFWEKQRCTCIIPAVTAACVNVTKQEERWC